MSETDLIDEQIAACRQRWRREHPELYAIVKPELSRVLRWMLGEMDRLRGSADGSVPVS